MRPQLPSAVFNEVYDPLLAFEEMRDGDKRLSQFCFAELFKGFCFCCLNRAFIIYNCHCAAGGRGF